MTTSKQMAAAEQLAAEGQRQRGHVLSLAYLDNPETAEFLACGYGIPPASILIELRSLWWRLRAQGVRLPAERRIIFNGCGI